MKTTSYSLDSWSRALVYGLGLSGRAAAELLRGRGVEVVGVDRRGAGELDLGSLAGDPGFELRAGSESEELPAVDGVVVSPGVPLDRPLLAAARAAGRPIIAEVELAWACLEGPVVGITGSNGKSTTTALTGALLSASGVPAEVCGNFGRPLSACVDGEPGRVFVVELSSFQLESIVHFRADAAAFLNLSADHLDRYPDLDGYGAAKTRIFAEQLVADTAVVNADDPWVASVATRARRRSFSRKRRVEDGCFVDGDRVVEIEAGGEEREVFQISSLAIAGPHNVENAMAASLLATAVGGRRETYEGALREFEGLPHRSRRIATLDGVDWIDDSKGTNPGATLRALGAFEDGTVHLVLGGRAKGGGFEELWPEVRRKARFVYLIGEASERFAEALGHDVPVRRAGDLETAVREARERAEPGEVVLLSPACASFDQYRDFVARGRHFQELVERERRGDGQEARL